MAQRPSADPTSNAPDASDAVPGDDLPRRPEQYSPCVSVSKLRWLNGRAGVKCRKRRGLACAAWQRPAGDHSGSGGQGQGWCRDHRSAVHPFGQIGRGRWRDSRRAVSLRCLLHPDLLRRADRGDGPGGSGYRGSDCASVALSHAASTGRALPCRDGTRHPRPAMHK